MWKEEQQTRKVQRTRTLFVSDIAGHPRSGPITELTCRARAAFRHEMKFFERK